MTATRWDPEQYARYAPERALPFRDLVALLAPERAERVLDLGCGPGTLTKRLHEAVGAGETLGVDLSDDMLAKARALAGTGLRFERGDASTIEPGGGWDLVFSNAALHFVSDHARQIARFASWLSPAGQLAFQIPFNHDQATHLVAAAVALEEPFRTLLSGWTHPDHRLPPEAYARVLHGLGFARQHVRVQVYGHLLPSPEDVVQWVKGSTLNEYRSRLAPSDFEAYLDRYRARLLAALPDDHPFFFTFKRLLLWAGR